MAKIILERLDLSHIPREDLSWNSLLVDRRHRYNDLSTSNFPSWLLSRALRSWTVSTLRGKFSAIPLAVAVNDDRHDIRGSPDRLRRNACQCTLSKARASQDCRGFISSLASPSCIEDTSYLKKSVKIPRSPKIASASVLAVGWLRLY